MLLTKINKSFRLNSLNFFKRNLQFTAQHDELRKTVQKVWISNINSTAIQLLIFQLIEKDVNPFVDEWEQQGAFPAHQVFKKFGEAGLLGITRPTGEFRSIGNDYIWMINV